MIRGGPNFIDSLPVLQTSRPLLKHLSETKSAIVFALWWLYFLNINDAIKPLPKVPNIIFELILIKFSSLCKILPLFFELFTSFFFIDYINSRCSSCTTNWIS